MLYYLNKLNNKIKRTSKMKRLEILKNSLAKKEAQQDNNFNSLYKHQAMTHGSPVNDKRPHLLYAFELWTPAL